MFRSEEKLRAYLRNVTDRLEPGGFFFGTTIDSDELVYRVRTSGSADNSISNDFYKVVLPQDTFSKSESPFGLKYYFYLKEAIGKETHQNQQKMVDEFLVIFPVLIKIAEEYGLKLIMKKNFRQYYDDMCSQNPVSGEDNFADDRQKNNNRTTFERMVKSKIEQSNLSQHDVD